MTVEKQKHLENTSSVQKTSEKYPHLEKKKETLKAQKEVKQETRRELTKVHLDNLKDQVGHTVVGGENIWRLIYNHAKETGKTPIRPEKLEGLNIVAGDKVFFSKDEVIIKYLRGGTKKIPFHSANNQQEILSNNKKDTRINTQNTNKKNTLPTDNHNNIPNNSGIHNPKGVDIPQKSQKQINNQVPHNKIFTIFDKESPIKGDQIAYKHEIEIKTAYGKQVHDLISKYCKGSIIDEDFLYGIIARESRFDKNAKSYTGVKGLGQFTKDTVLSIAKMNEAKTQKDPQTADLYISNEIRRGTKNKQKGQQISYEMIDSKALQPLNQLKLTISYLLYLENLFSDIPDKKFKTELIITAYNLGPGKTKEILDNYKGVKNWEGLKSALTRATKHGDVTKAKEKEVKEYVAVVKDNIQKSKYIKIASL